MNDATIALDPDPLRGGGARALRPLSPAEAQYLGAAFAAMPPWSAYPYSADALAAYLARSEPHAPRLAITCGGEIAGAVGWRLDWLRGAYVQFLGLRSAFQGRGLGEAVMTWLEREARSAGERNLWVAVSDFNDGAIRFYARHGFVATARLDALVRDGRTEILMRKRLA